KGGAFPSKSGWLDSNQRSPAPEAGGLNQALPHPDRSVNEQDQGSGDTWPGKVHSKGPRHHHRGGYPSSVRAGGPAGTAAGVRSPRRIQEKNTIVTAFVSSARGRWLVAPCHLSQTLGRRLRRGKVRKKEEFFDGPLSFPMRKLRLRDLLSQFPVRKEIGRHVYEPKCPRDLPPHPDRRCRAPGPDWGECRRSSRPSEGQRRPLPGEKRPVRGP